VSIPPAWHPDPTGRHDHRWWDGTQWTEHVADAGVAGVDPLDAGGTADEGAAAGEGAVAGEGAEPSEGGPDTAGHLGDNGVTSPGTGAAWASPQGEPTTGAGTAGGVGSAAGSSWGQGGEPPAGGWPASSEGQAGWGGAPTATQPPTDGLAISSLIVGLVSLGSVVFILGAIFLFGGIGGIVAVVLGAVALSRIKKTGRRGRGMAITGLVTGILAIVGTALLWVAFLAAGPAWFDFMGDFMGEYQQCMDEVGDEEYCEQLLEDEIEQRFFGN
jgi:hypothetical protein